MNKGLSTLLDLHGMLVQQDHGYWVKVEAYEVVSSAHTPHGIRYSLTLHDQYGKRVLGYDNAHGVRPPNKFKHAGRILAHDHKHRHASDKGMPYEFESPEQLLSDFFRDVDRILKEVSQS